MKRILHFAVRTASEPAFFTLAVFLLLAAAFGGWAEALCVLLSAALMLADRARMAAAAESYYISACRTAYGAEGDLLPSVLTPSAASASSFLAKASAVSLSVCLIFAIRAFAGGMSTREVFSGMLAAAAVSVSAVSASHRVFFGRIISERFSKLAGEESGLGPVVADPSVAEKLASADGVLILDPSLIYDTTAEVRAVWSSGSLYSGMALSESGMRGAAECGLVMYAIAQNAPQGSVRPSHEEAFLSFGEKVVGDFSSILRSASYAKPVFGSPAAGDVTVKIRYAGGQIDSEVRLRSCSRAAVSACGYYRLHNGAAAQLGREQLDSALSAFDSMTEAGLVPYVFVSVPNAAQGSDPSVFPRGKILECVTAVGGDFPEDNPAVVSALSDFGTEPLLILPSSGRAAMRFAADSGICEPGTGDAEFCTPEELTADGGIGEAELSTKRVFRGFSRDDCVRLIRRFKREGKNTAAVIKREGDLPLLAEAVCAVGVAGSADAEARRSLPAFVRPASSEDGSGGLSSFFSLAAESVSVCGRVSSFRSVSIAFGVMMLVAVLSCALTGDAALSPSAPAVLLVSEAVLAISASVLASDRMITPGRSAVPDESPLRAILYSAGLGLLTAAAVEVFGFVFFGEDQLSRLAYMTCSSLFSGLAITAAVRFRVRKKQGITGINFRFLALSLAAVSAAALALLIPLPDSLAAVFGRAASVPICLAASLAPAAVPFVYLGAGMLIASQQPRERFGEQ